MTEPCVEIEGVTKRFGEDLVLKEVNLVMESGKVYGIVGNNGSGKTVLMKCICGFLPPSSGRIRVFGKRIGVDRDFPESLGVIIETPGFLPHETGLQNLMLLAAMSGRADRLRARRAMIELGLDPDEKKPVWKYSLGQRQRLGFAQAFMEDPDVLILDEPFNAMDKASMEEVHDLLQRFKAQDKTVLLASHSAEDIARACDVIYEMEDGELHLAKQ